MWRNGYRHSFEHRPRLGAEFLKSHSYERSVERRQQAAADICCLSNIWHGEKPNLLPSLLRARICQASENSEATPTSPHFSFTLQVRIPRDLARNASLELKTEWRSFAAGLPVSLVLKHANYLPFISLIYKRRQSGRCLHSFPPTIDASFKVYFYRSRPGSLMSHAGNKVSHLCFLAIIFGFADICNVCAGCGEEMGGKY